MGLSNLSNILILYVFVLSTSIFSHKNSAGSVHLDSKKLNECLRCKVLTDSFTYWFNKTARGKHEGGDVAWEETKLKSYARSEMRLVEIQENLCSESKKHQDICYTLAAEIEHLLETWWFQVDHDILDLYTWMCIDNLQHCCPVNHYGEMCTPCPRDKNNKICSGYGKCNGDGTRKGNGTCICTTGYIGSNCNECDKHFYKTNTESCKPCHNACNECHGDGVAACVKCTTGWSMELGVCIDVDECLNSSICKIKEFCKNTEGSYICKSCDITCKTCTGPGAFNCTSCSPNDTLWIGKCMSVNIQQEIYKSVFIRITSYLCLIFLTIFIINKSILFGSFIFLIISTIIFYFEKSNEIRLAYIVIHYWKTWDHK